MNTPKEFHFCKVCNLKRDCMTIGKRIHCLWCGYHIQTINGECRTDSLGRVSSTPEIPKIINGLQYEQEQREDIVCSCGRFIQANEVCQCKNAELQEQSNEQ